MIAQVEPATLPRRLSPPCDNVEAMKLILAVQAGATNAPAIIKVVGAHLIPSADDLR